MDEKENKMRKIKMIETKNKKAVSHVEMVLSFIIFTGFIIFLIAIFNPLKISGSDDIIVDNLEREISKQISVKVKFLSLSLNQKPLENCFYIYYPDLDNVIVRDENKIVVNAHSEGSGENRKIFINYAGNFYYIYSCEEFIENIVTDTCEEFIDMLYNLGLYRSYDMVSSRKLQDLAADYISNYESVKERLKIAGSKDFSFSVSEVSTGNLILEAEKKIPSRIKVTAKDFPIQIVYDTGEFEYVILNIKVW